MDPRRTKSISTTHRFILRRGGTTHGTLSSIAASNASKLVPARNRYSQRLASSEISDLSSSLGETLSLNSMLIMITQWACKSPTPHTHHTTTPQVFRAHSHHTAAAFAAIHFSTAATSAAAAAAASASGPSSPAAAAAAAAASSSACRLRSYSDDDCHRNRK